MTRTPLPEEREGWSTSPRDSVQRPLIDERLLGLTRLSGASRTDRARVLRPDRDVVERRKLILEESCKTADAPKWAS